MVMSFAVECSNDPHTPEAAFDKRFESLVEAEAFIEQCSKFRAIWLPETGLHVDSKKEDWFYFWWSERVSIDAGWGKPEGRRRGYAYQHLSKAKHYIIDYIPTAEVII